MTLPAELFSARRLASLLALVAGGCGDAGNPERADYSNTSAGARSGMPLPVEGVQVRLDVPDTVASGEMVPMTLRLTNTSAVVRELYLRGRDVAFDIVITDPTGDEVWRLLKGDPIPAILQLRTLKPGETLELRHEWHQRARGGDPVPDGAYTVRAEVLTDGSGSLVSNDAQLLIRSRVSGSRRQPR